MIPVRRDPGHRGLGGAGAGHQGAGIVVGVLGVVAGEGVERAGVRGDGDQPFQLLLLVFLHEEDRLAVRGVREAANAVVALVEHPEARAVEGCGPLIDPIDPEIVVAVPGLLALLVRARIPLQEPQSLPVRAPGDLPAALLLVVLVGAVPDGPALDLREHPAVGVPHFLETGEAIHRHDLGEGFLDRPDPDVEAVGRGVDLVDERRLPDPVHPPRLHLDPDELAGSVVREERPLVG